MREHIVPILNDSLMITIFVLTMMVLIEYVNIQSKNLWAHKLRKSPFLQILTAGFLGIIPGCMGAFTVVSLYTHRMIGFAALVTTMIATSGDEAFAMFALFPGKALILQLILFVIALLAGWIVHLFSKNKVLEKPHGFIVHHEETCKCYDTKKIIPQLSKITFERSLLIIGVLIFLILLFTRFIGPEKWDWQKYTFLAGGLFLLFVFITVPDHFLKDHFYQHILKKHLLRIFLWTLGAFIVLHFITANLTLNNLVENNMYLILLIAVVLGLIPESGPHLVFVTMFSQGYLPFSILIASSIVQDGHGMIPLLAESRTNFIKVKTINLLIGGIIGFLLLQLDF